MRGLSDNFMKTLKDGNLKPVLERVKKDDTLMLAIRKNYINIYYRGGSIIKITEKIGTYACFFDSQYDLSEGKTVFYSLDLPGELLTDADSEKWVAGIPALKELMDFWLKEHPKNEREFQQVVERENNRSGISNETEYFITDIELAESDVGGRFDMIAVKWPADSRQNSNKCIPAFIEMKYGDAALGGKSGILKHLKDITAYLSEKKNYENAVQMITNQFNQLYKLELIKFNYTEKVRENGLRLDVSKKPEFIFLFANHNPRSGILKDIIDSNELARCADSDLFDLKFFCSCDAGYGMHDSNMLGYNQYVKRFK